jgi:hypothetical protein
MSLDETRVLTIGWDSAARMFDDSLPSEYLAEREVVSKDRPDL